MAGPIPNGKRGSSKAAGVSDRRDAAMRNLVSQQSAYVTKAGGAKLSGMRSQLAKAESLHSSGVKFVKLTASGALDKNGKYGLNATTHIGNLRRRIGEHEDKLRREWRNKNTSAIHDAQFGN